jgi:hypothetical protein
VSKGPLPQEIIHNPHPGASDQTSVTLPKDRRAFCGILHAFSCLNDQITLKKAIGFFTPAREARNARNDCDRSQ